MDSASPDSSPTVAAPAFQPDALAVRYLEAILELAEAGTPPTLQAVATAMKLAGKNPRKRLQKWLERNPEVRKWASRTLETAVLDQKGPILTRFAQLAARGSLRHAEFVARVVGWLPERGVSVARTGSTEPSKTGDQLAPGAWHITISG